MGLHDDLPKYQTEEMLQRAEELVRAWEADESKPLTWLRRAVFRHVDPRVLSPNATLRMYRCAPGFFGLAITCGPAGHYALQLGPWVVTTEPGD